MVLVVASSMEVWRRDGDGIFGVLVSCFVWVNVIGLRSENICHRKDFPLFYLLEESEMLVTT